jgi:hypothetical protein
MAALARFALPISAAVPGARPGVVGFLGDE